MMNPRRQVVARSFGHARDINVFYLVLILGGGAFFSVTDLVFGSQSFIPVLFYFLGAMLLLLPLLYGEIIWGRWTQRSMFLSFFIFSKQAGVLGALSMLAIALLVPGFLKESAVFFEMSRIALLNQGEIPNGISSVIEGDLKSLALWMLCLWNVALLMIVFNSRIVRKILSTILGFVFLVWLVVLVLNFHDINSSKILSFISWDVSELDFSFLLRAFFAPLFYSLAGLGLYQNYAAYSCLATLKQDASGERYWKLPGRPFALALRFGLLSSLLIFFPFFLMVPFSPMLMSGPKTGLSSFTVMTEWLPQIWNLQNSWLPNFNFLWLSSLGALKFSALLLFIDFCVFQIESNFKWVRYKILIHLSLVSLGLFLLSLVPSVYANIWNLLHKGLWPFFTLSFCIWLSYQMPLKMQGRILGRTLFLDQLATVLAASLRYLLPILLLLYILYWL